MITARFVHLRGLLTIFLFLCGVANICQARIGDTLGEAIKRYGKVVKKESANEFAMFKEAPYYITAHFHDDKTDAIVYVKTPSGTSTKGAFSDREIEELLRINGHGQTWERSKAKAGLNKWETEDKTLHAAYSESKFLVIATADYLKRLHETANKKKTAAEKNKQKPLSTSHKKGTAGKKPHSPGKSSSAPDGHGD
jgi:hypothetical protein